MSMSPLPHSAGKARGDLLQQPRVAVRIVERGIRLVRASLRVGSRYRALVEVEHLADVRATADQLGARRIDVTDSEQQSLSGPGRRGGEALAELDRALRVRGRQLDYPEVLPEGDIGVQAPTEILVELLCPVDVGHGQCHGLELQVDRRRCGTGARGVCTRACAAHTDLQLSIFTGQASRIEQPVAPVGTLVWTRGPGTSTTD